MVIVLQSVDQSLHYTSADDCIFGLTLMRTASETDRKSVKRCHFIKVDCVLDAGGCQHSDVQSAYYSWQ